MSTKFLTNIFILAMSSFLMGQTIYVNYSTGNDFTGNGSSGSPYKSFHKGYTMVSSGGILDLTGIFDWTNPDETGDAATTGYSIGKAITIQGQGADQTIIQAASTSNTAICRVFDIGAAITVTFSNLSIRYGKVWESDSTPYGGGIAVYSGANVTISDCHIYENLSWNTGGGVDAYQSNVSINNSTISDNFGYHGGGLSLRDGTYSIINSTICNNYADGSGYGGGIYLKTGTTTITNCTISNNESTSPGGGIGLEAMTLTIMNTIIANNIASSTPNDFDYYSGTVIDNGYNIVEYSTLHTWVGTGDITSDQPNLNLSSTLAANSTSNSTPTLKTTVGSVAINAGNDTGAPATDQRGATRSGTTDIGAYEYWDDAGSLPVELTSFNALVSDINVQLNWQTVTEVNNFGFSIQRKSGIVNGEWEEISFVEGHGNSNSPNEYSYTDTPNGAGKFTYRLKQLDTDGKFEYSQEVEVDFNSPTKFIVKQNFPNPFNPTTVINYSIATADNVTIKVYNVLGMEVATLVNKHQEVGKYKTEFNASELVSGVYFYKISSGNNLEIKKMLLFK
jgi:hypothetical protein